MPQTQPAQKEPELDFALAFRDGDTTPGAGAHTRPARQQDEHAGWLAGRTQVRVVLAEKKQRGVVYSVGSVEVRDGQGTARVVRGRLEIMPAGRERITVGHGRGRGFEAALPCTLQSKNPYNFFEFEENSYRGSLLLLSDQQNSVQLVNLLGVEEYLRGVVPLEIGPRQPEEIEAVKAQAIAARTYTYKRMEVRASQPWDLRPTVADQVYGGVNAENGLADRAIRATENLVLLHADTLIQAYYHSTCGGTTANIEDVWDKPAAPYLVSVSDRDTQGRAYCHFSRYATWEEAWDRDQLGTLLERYSPKAFPRNPARGRLRSVKVSGRFACGRVKSLVVQTSRGACYWGGDKLRFAFRRPARGSPILRSSWFEVLSGGGATIRLRGRGYGHGVGMCQVGAVGRARHGASFWEILSAYYTGVELARVRQQE